LYCSLSEVIRRLVAYHASTGLESLGLGVSENTRRVIRDPGRKAGL
jgi:hypothetical protein